MQPPETRFPALKDVVPVILAGGEGSRLRPLSTPETPKPFLNLPFFKHTMLQHTVLRARDVMKPPVIVCAARHLDKVSAQLAEINVRPARILLEPEGRNTGPAIAAAAHYLGYRDNPLMMVMPSDHAMSRPDELFFAAEQGRAVAEQAKIVLFGIKPDGPETRYGYIRIAGDGADGVHAVMSFHEKPPRYLAATFVRRGDYFWNSGIFLTSAHSCLAAFKQHSPATHDAAHAAVARGRVLKNAVLLDAQAFLSCAAEAVDKTIMEKISPEAQGSLVMLAVSPGWRDMGTWGGLAGGIVSDLLSA